MPSRKVFDSDGESMDEVKPVRRKRKKAHTSPPSPNDVNKAPRRSGRFRRPPSPMGVPEETGRAATKSRRVSYSIELTPSPEPSPSPPKPTMSSPDPPSSPEMPPPSPLEEIPDRDPFAGNTVQDAIDTLEQDLHDEQDRSESLRREVEKLKRQLREKDKSQTTIGDAKPSLAKRDKIIEGKDREIRELQEALETTRDLRTASRLALDTRDKELEKLRGKHKALIKVADGVANKWGGMGELADAVEEAAE